MHDAGKIVAGLALFAGLVTAPLWYNIARGTLDRPLELRRAAEAPCVAPAAQMRVQHMSLLDGWRDAVVRRGDRVYVAADGRRHEMSLTGTCLRCHSEPAEFCDRCHARAGVEPYCWDCHQQPEGR
jgi:hypothetical protein